MLPSHGIHVAAKDQFLLLLSFLQFSSLTSVTHTRLSFIKRSHSGCVRVWRGCGRMSYAESTLSPVLCYEIIVQQASTLIILYKTLSQVVMKHNLEY